MLYFFTDPYEDEIFYSILDRYNRYSGNLSTRKTVMELFGIRTYNQNSNFPSYLDYFSKQLQNNDLYSSDYFISEHTILPFYKPFLPKERFEQIVRDIKGDKATSIHMRIGDMAGGICKNFGIRVCSSCMCEDEQRYGESYIHRIHQVPGNQICSIHTKKLKQVILPKYFGRRELVNLQKCEIGTSNHIINSNTINEFINFSDDIIEIFENNFKLTNLEDVIMKYRIMLMKKGFSSVGGKINWSKVNKELLDFYSSDFLGQLESNISKENNYKWTEQILYEKKLVHPIRHLLFIRFLFGSVHNFILFDKLEYKPFGSGPWPCLNPAAAHYKKDVVFDMKISERSRLIQPLGIFKCKCGYIYTRLGPDKTIADRYKKKTVKAYGDIWLDALSNNIRKQIYNISELARIMECDFKTIGKYANKLGIFDLLNSNMKTELINDENIPRYNKNLEKVYKEDIINFLNSNPYSIRQDVEKNLRKQCAWLRRYRMDWFNEILPKPLDNNIDNRKCKVYANWQDRDNQLSMNVQQIIDEYEEGNKRKITISFLCTMVKFPIYKYLDKLPKTKDILIKNKII